MKRILTTLLAAAICCWGIWQAGRIGYARTLAEYAANPTRDNVNVLALRLAAVTDQKGAAARAAALLPDDAEGFGVLGEVLPQFEDYPAAIAAVESAVALRPRDYYLWMLLGLIRDQNHDQAGALRAFQQSTALAPTYAQPHWQLGNLLLRMDRVDQAFAELRLAAHANPNLWPNIVDLAWGVYGHDAKTVVRVVAPESDVARQALALFFARHDQGAMALEQFRALQVKSEAKSQSLLDELLRAKSFREAFEVWRSTTGITSSEGSAEDSIRDGGFEGVLTVGQSGFGWQIAPNVENIAMSIDEGTHQSGSRSLRLDFHGNSDPALRLVTQIILVRPATRYHLGVFALTKDYVSAADPVITLIDATDSKSTVLAQSPSLRSDANGWREFNIDFNTNANTQAVMFTLARSTCANSPCPAFGTVWLDSVSIEKR